MVAEGCVNNRRKMLFLVDTGLASNRFTCPESTVREAGIKLQKDQASEGIGGGGEKKVLSIPFVVDRLTLGDAVEQGVRWVYMKGFLPIDKQVGFHIGGLISRAFFKHYALTFNFEGMRYFLKRTGKN